MEVVFNSEFSEFSSRRYSRPIGTIRIEKMEMYPFTENALDNCIGFFPPSSVGTAQSKTGLRFELGT